MTFVANSNAERALMRRPLGIFALLVAACAACTSQASRPSAGTPARSPEVELRALDSLWAHMYAANDTVAADRLYADDLVFTSANGRTKTKHEEMNDIRPSPGFVMDYFRTVPSTVRVAGDSGFVAGTASWRFMMNGQPREVRRSYDATYVRGGPLGWRIVRMRMGTTP
jgi:ketosteroid isomerase-like protein